MSTRRVPPKTSMHHRLPLLVQIEYHPASPEAANVADYLYSVLNDDPAVPGLRISTCFTPNDGSTEPPTALIAAEADRVVVVLLSDDHMTVNARKLTKAGHTWADYALKLRKFCESSSAHRFMPVQLTENGWPLDSRLADLNFLRAWALEDANERKKFIARRLMHLLIRRLRPHEDNEDAPAVTIFLSHTKMDFDNEPRVVKSLLAHLTAIHPEKTWFDSGDIATGSQFEKAIERGVSDAALLAVVTDSYSSRSWCRREVLFAKDHQRPVVVVDAVQEREIRRFPYAGNAPVIRWKGNAQDVVDLLLRETLRHAHAEVSLNKRKRPGDEILPGGPELVTIVHRTKKPILYPDPPLGSEELAVLARTGVRVETPLERHARANDLRKRSLIVALSVSEAEDLAKYGLRKTHLDEIFLELSRYLLIAGIRIAYGGHLKPSGYTLRLADLLHDPIIEHLRGEMPKAGLPMELISYLAWPMFSTIQDEAKLGPLVEVRHCNRPDDVDESLDPVFVPQPTQDIPIDTVQRRFGWSRGLTVMRERQTKEVAARVIVGGRLGPTHDGYKGKMPGVLEETLVSIQAERPVYLVGAFGGCARLVVDALEGNPRQELTWDFQQRVEHSVALRQLYIDRGLSWDEYDQIKSALQHRGLGGLKNGLNISENRELATTRSAERIIELIFRGLQQCYPQRRVKQRQGRTRPRRGRGK